MKAIAPFFLLFACSALAGEEVGGEPPKRVPVRPPAAKAAENAAAPSVTTRQEVETKTAQDLPGKMIADFFGQLAIGKIDEAYGTLTNGSRVIEKPDDLRILKAKTKEAIDVFGSIVGYELVETKPIGTRLVRRTYLSLGSEFPLRWRFYFYNANNRWRLIDMRVDDKLTGMFDEAPEARADDAKGASAP